MESTQLRLAISHTIQALLESDRPYYEIDREIDTLLGLHYQSIEAAIPRAQDIGEELYLGHQLSAEGLYTSFVDFYHIGQQLGFKDQDVFVDLGAGCGRSKLLYDLLWPNTKSIAIEYVAERILAGQAAAKKLNLETSHYIQADLFKLDLPSADYYFFYLQAGPLLMHLLERLRKMAEQKPFQVIAIESHGDFIKSLAELAPWLKLQSQLKTKSHRHNPFIHIYQSLPTTQMQAYNRNFDQMLLALQQLRSSQSQLSMEQIPTAYRSRVLMQLSLNHDIQLVIQDQDVGSNETYVWLASIYGLQHSLRQDQYRSRYPEREFHQAQIIALTWQRDTWWRTWADLRSQGWQHEDWGAIRKIVVEPQAQIEFATGKRIAPQQLILNYKVSLV